MNIEPVSHAREWLMRMARMLPRSGEDGDLAVRIDDTAKLLAIKVPAALLNAESLEFCLRRIKFFPSYAELWGRLQAYQRDHKPQGGQKALPPPPGHEALFAQLDAAPLSTADRHSARIWLRHAIEGSAGEKELVRRLGVERRYSPAAYRWIVENNEGAAQIARRLGWAEADAPQGPVDPTQFQRLAGTLGGRMRDDKALGGALQAPPLYPASRPLGGSADAASDALSASPQGSNPTPPRRPGQLSPEALRATRMANPALRAMVERQEAAQAPPAKAISPADTPALSALPWDDDDAG